MPIQMLVPPYGNFDYLALLPLGIVAVTPLVVLLADLVLPAGGFRRFTLVGLSVAGLLGAIYTLVQQYASHQFGPAFGYGFILGGFSIAFNIIVCVAAIFSRPWV